MWIYQKRSFQGQIYYFRIRSISRSALGYFQSCQKSNGKNGKSNSYVAFNKVQSCSAERMQLERLQYVEEMIINFERAVERNNGVFFNYALVNKPKKFKMLKFSTQLSLCLHLHENSNRNLLCAYTQRAFSYK